MNVYSFFIRSYFGAYRSAYNIEKQDGKTFWNNKVVQSIVSSILFCGFVYKVFGLQAFICFLIQVLGAVFYLEVINYIEHYGLRRKKIGKN